MLRGHERYYPGCIEITRRAQALNEISPHLVPNPREPGWVGSGDPRWLALYEDGRRAIDETSINSRR
ncbi:hypothetical protein ACYCVF_33615 [Bradyrhizobium sp. 1.29L]